MRHVPTNGTIRFQVEIPRALHRQLRTAAIEEGISAASIVRDLLTDWSVSQDTSTDALRAAFEAGARAERARIRSLLEPVVTTPAAAPASPGTSTRSGLPLRPPTSAATDTSIGLETRCPLRETR